MKIMKKLFTYLFYLFTVFVTGCNPHSQLDLSRIDPGQYDSTWYNHTPLRFIQTNLNETDAAMDIDAYMQSLVDASASMVVFNVGGIEAFYDTKLPFHHKSPYLTNDRDLVWEIIKKCHEKGIKFIARFDMSKVNESIATQKPEWLYVGTDGNNVNYNGEVHTCLNGGYQQEYVFEILREAIAKYPFDAIFFNMGGYQTSDYSQVNHGLCQCRNCKKRFHDLTGLNLPVKPDMSDPAYRKYREFQSITSDELDQRVRSFIKSLNPNLVFQHRVGEILRSESGTSYTSAIDWNYHATENVKRTLNSFKNQTPNDTYNYLMGMDYRHTATSPNIGRIFIAEQMLNGAGPGIYLMGRIETQLDRAFLPTLNEMFGFHKKNEKLFTNVQSLARVGLIMGSGREFRGIMKLLIEEHVMYDLIQPGAVENEELPGKLEDYDALILGNVTNMDENFISLIDNYVKNGGQLLVTGFPGIDIDFGENKNKIRLQSLGEISEVEVFSQPRSTYLKITGNDRLELGIKELEDFDVIMMNSRFLKCKTQGNTKNYLRLVPNTMHGPPEKCYFTEKDVTDFPGIIANEFGNGKTVFIPWLIGAQYEWKGNNGQRALFNAALNSLLKIQSTLSTDASPLIEVTHLGNRNGAFEWIGMINHSGQIGNIFREPIPIYNTNMKLKPVKPVKNIYMMRSQEPLRFKESEGWIEFTVPKLVDYEMILCLYE